jgi:hypothetical protein
MDGAMHPGYRGAQPQIIQRSVNRAIQLLPSISVTERGKNARR